VAEGSYAVSASFSLSHAHAWMHIQDRIEPHS